MGEAEDAQLELGLRGSVPRAASLVLPLLWPLGPALAWPSQPVGLSSLPLSHSCTFSLCRLRSLTFPLVSVSASVLIAASLSLPRVSTGADLCPTLSLPRRGAQ